MGSKEERGNGYGSNINNGIKNSSKQEERLPYILLDVSQKRPFQI